MPAPRRMMMAAAGVSTPVEATFETSQVDTTDTGSPLTFSGVDLGDAAANRHIVVGVGVSWGGSAQVSGVTVGGQSATEIIEVGLASQKASLHIAAVPTGATGDIVITTTGTGESWGIGVWRLIGANATPDDTGSSTADPMVDTINCPAGGVIIGYAHAQNGNTHTWTNLTEQFDETTEGSFQHTGAFDTFAATQSGRSITCNPDGSPDSRRMVLASFGPA